jgi:hypothetical protein
MKKHWRNLMQDQKYLGSWDLEVDGKYEPKVVTIEKIYVGDFSSQGGTEKKPFAKLKEFNKPMVLQAENFKRLEKFFDSFDYNSYVGKQIVLSVESIKFRGDVVPALRFSTRPLPAKKDEMKVLTDSSLKVAIEAVKSKQTSLDKIKSQYKLTPDQLKQLEDAQA